MNEPLGHPAPWPAPGKLNLFLHVVGRRPDGYHLLQTAFQFIDLCDTLRFFRRPDGVVDRLADVPGVDAEDDLTVRAARLLAGQDTCSGRAAPGVAIGLDKSLPLGGGVGGGSADAATVLVALNELWGLELPTDALADLGVRLGADVPVFVHGLAAWAEGVGERLVPVDFAEPVYVLVRPDVAVGTAEIFKAPELTVSCRPVAATIANPSCVHATRGWPRRSTGSGVLVPRGSPVRAPACSCRWPTRPAPRRCSPRFHRNGRRG